MKFRFQLEGFWSAFALLCLLFVGVLFLLPNLSPKRRFGRHPCLNNLRTIGLALHDYHGAYQSFPPPYVADASDRPMHSWRVLILPQLGQEELYQAYDFTEPWNGTHNRKLHDRIVDVYRCPKNKQSDSTVTTYVAVVGDETMWPEGKRVTFSDIHDGETSTIFIIEISNSDIHGMEPRDLRFEEMSF